MGILVWAVKHGVALENLDCLVKTIQKYAPDSEILGHVKPLKRTSAAYHLSEGLAKTEIERTLSEMRLQPFSITFDAGTKGSKRGQKF